MPDLMTKLQAARNGNGSLPPGVSLTKGQKMVDVNQSLGNKAIANQQSTTRVLYDTLPLNGLTFLQFFITASNRAFPDTNLNQNKLQAGESFVCERIYFAGLVKSATDTSNIIEALSVLNTHFYFGQWSLAFDTITVIKPLPLNSQLPAFNHYGKHQTNESNRLDAQVVIGTDINFAVNLQLDTYTAIANAFCRCGLEGFGTLFSPKVQF